MSTSEVVGLLERALRAEIDAQELAEIWPDIPHDEYMAEIRDDLATALEHVPGPQDGPWRPDLDRWRQMPEYHDLELHLARLRQVIPPEDAR